jgi:hypothetical protein
LKTCSAVCSTCPAGTVRAAAACVFAAVEVALAAGAVWPLAQTTPSRQTVATLIPLQIIRLHPSFMSPPFVVRGSQTLQRALKNEIYRGKNRFSSKW